MAQDTLTLSRPQCEALFLKENLQLISQKLDITQAEAQVSQARLWPNPGVSIDNVNLWSSPAQRAAAGDALPQGGLGRYQQLGLSVDQLIQTAGKRRKLIALNQVTADKARRYFEEVLRGLKLELRHQLTNLQYLQTASQVYKDQIASIHQLVAAYESQVEKGYATRADYMRLKAQELELSKEINDLWQQLNEAQKELNLLLRLPATTYLRLTPDGFLKDTRPLQQWTLQQLLATARDNRPDYKIAILEQTGAQRQLAYEKANAVPDLRLKAGYDRGGNLYPNFIGFGVETELPFFNRNQGNIRAARAAVQQAGIGLQIQSDELDNETALAYKNLLRAINFYSQIKQDYESGLDALLDSYLRNFKARNISMLEFLDFLEAYRSNKNIILQARKDVSDNAEELNYSTGTDILP